MARSGVGAARAAGDDKGVTVAAESGRMARKGAMVAAAVAVAPAAPTLGRSATGAGERSLWPARERCGLLRSTSGPVSVAEEAAGPGLRLEERAQRQRLQGHGNMQQETGTVSGGRQLLQEAMSSQREEARCADCAPARADIGRQIENRRQRVLKKLSANGNARQQERTLLSMWLRRRRRK